jgi:hypothetical protein
MVDNPLYLEDLAAGLTTFATCWRVMPPGRPPVLGTDCAQDLVITVTDAALLTVRPELDLTGRYTSFRGVTPSDARNTSDLSVSNMEVQGALKDAGELLPGITAADIESGILNGAPVHVFYLNWSAPDRWQKTRRAVHRQALR